ncbi:MAG TPA: hypothetical protein VLK82_05060 [Candidatus Tectomicrobia bacterium]|nr:hypothetical protein [Candidatus Tectomicrobia bacterium]
MPRMTGTALAQCLALLPPAMRELLISGYAYDVGPLGPQGLPLVNPPYGRITAINLHTGEHLWMRPVGEGPREHSALRHLHLPPLGWPRRSFPLLTKSVLWVAQQCNNIDLDTIDPPDYPQANSR